MAAATLISTRAELDHAIAHSGTTPVLLFKHSLTCPISTAARDVYGTFLEGRSEGDGFLYALIEIQNARDVSTAAAQSTGVQHESPQALLVKDGAAVWHASHWDISVEALRGAVEAAPQA